MRRALVALCLILVCTPLMAQKVTLQWDLSVSEPLGAGGGYKCYTGRATGVYATAPAVSVAPGVNTATITGLPYGRSYFVCTSFVADGTESGYSNEVNTVIKPQPPKLNSVQQIAAIIKNVVGKLAALFQPKNQGLRITFVG